MRNLILGLLIVTILIQPLGQLSRVPGIEQAGFNLYLTEVLLAVIIILWLMKKLVLDRSLRLDFYSLLFLFFCLWAGLGLLNAWRWFRGIELVAASLYLLRLVEYFFLYPIVSDLFTDRQARQKIIRCFFYVFFVFASVGLWQYTFFPDFSKYVAHGWDPHYYRVLSTFFDPNFAGLYLIFGLILALSLVFEKKIAAVPSWLVWLSLPLLMLSLILTFSRSTYLALMTSLSLFGWKKSKKLLISFYLMAFLAFLFVPRVQSRVLGALNLDVTARFRVQSWSQTLSIIQEHPWLGVGFNTFRYAQEQAGFFRDERGISQPSGRAGAGSDSSWLFLWATTGLCGLMIWLLLIGKMWQQAWAQLTTDDLWKRSAALVVFSVWPALFVHSQFVNSLFYPWVMFVFWIFWGLLQPTHDENR